MAAHNEQKSRKRKSDGQKPLNKPPFKKKSTTPAPSPPSHDDPAPPAAAPSAVFQDDDPAFPRGGASMLSRQEVAEARAEAETEFEREHGKLGREGKGKKKKKGARKADTDGDDELGSLFGDGITGKLPRFANRVSLKSISPMMKLWGVVVEVNSKDLVVSIPGGLRGYVRAEEVWDIDLDKDCENISLYSLFHIGQLVSCIVLRVDDDKKDVKGNKRIWLSLRLSLLYKGLALDTVQEGMALTAQVKSIEDHGYILYFGVSSATGFLPRREQGDAEIQIGQLLQCVVKNIDKARAVAFLSSEPDLVSKCDNKDLRLSIDLLVPGMMVNARVHSTLENGIMLSFLTYFTGTVDIFHLQNSFPSGTWKDDYHPNKKVNARILFIDPSTRAVGLTLNSHLIHNKVPPFYAKTGDIYDNSRIIRVDRGVGLLLEIPSSPAPSPAYVSIFDIADEEVSKLEKKYKEGNHVRVRVLGMRHLEGLAVGTLKASAFEGSVFTHSDVKPGMLVSAKVISVESFGAIVQFTSGVKALCPLPHMSEFDIVKPVKKFKVGAQLMFRVLGCKSKRITVTHKKTLVKSKLNVLASYTDAAEGLITHGWITKIEKHGCFVRFYNGVQGFAHRSELGLDLGSEAAAIYHVGQVVKCRIISSVPAARKISISFVISTKRIDKDCTVSAGGLICGTVEKLTPGAVILHVNNIGYLKGTITNEHLADHQVQVTLLRSSLRPGYEFDQLLVLDIEGSNLLLSAKYSLLSSATAIPSDIALINPSTVVHGYICNIIEAGCFVRFLGRLTGFAPKNKTTDEQVDNLLNAFYLGQSVRSHILDVAVESSRIKLSLKQSLCFSVDVSFIQGYFLMEEKIASLQISDGKNYDFSWVKSFIIGAVVEGEVQEIKEYGVVVTFKDHDDIVGIIEHYQCGISPETGSTVRAVVLDIAKSDSHIDLSLKPDLVNSTSSKIANVLPPKKKRQRAALTDLELHQTVTAVVEIVKENYLVLSIPEYNYAIGYASVTDYNTQKLRRKHFINGQSVLATVGALPNPCSCGRLLLQLKSLSEVTETSSSKRAKKKSSYLLGNFVEAEIIDIKPLELHVKFGVGFHGRVHITEVIDDDNSLDNPLVNFRIGQIVNAKIVAQSGKSGKGLQWELSLKPSHLAGAIGTVDGPSTGELNCLVGSAVKGYVVKVDDEWVWLTISRYVMAHLFILDSSYEPSELQGFQKRFNLGQAVTGHVISLNKEKKLVRLISRPPCNEAAFNSLIDIKSNKETEVSSMDGVAYISQGDVIGGRIKRILSGVGGMLVQIGPHLYARVHYTELADGWVPHPLSEYEEKQFVTCRVLEISRSSEGSLHVDLSLRASSVGNKIVSSPEDDSVNCTCKRLDSIDDLYSDMAIQGYVKNVTSKGCFIMLSRSVDARILLSNLSDGFIENPQEEFPIGKLVHGRVLSVEPSSKKVDVTLKTGAENQMSKFDETALHNLRVGDIISGKIRRTESFGLFISIDNTNRVGLCHISELSDDPIDNIETKYRAGDRVVAKILKIDDARNRVSLGMKRTHIPDVNITDKISGHEGTRNVSGTAVDSVLLPSPKYSNLSVTRRIVEQEENGYSSILTQADSRAFIPPLEVPLGDSEGSDIENDLAVSLADVESNVAVDQKSDRRLKKKAKEEREFQISVAEERSLQNNIPTSEDEFEKLVRTSPNSSFLWIKYMAFLLSVADVEKARSIAERALKTINVREEGEKLNIWVAYFNLENEYGNPPEEAVKKIFQRALQYCDPKKLHIALLGVYERTKQFKLAEELIERMTKKFKHSCKVWLLGVQNYFNQGKDGIQPVVNRALLCLPKNKHIKFITRTSILEFKCGVPDIGRSMFEGILREYPKRTDIWSIYLDQEIRLGDIEVTRALFERATCLSLPPKKMKFLFKKYLDYEKSHGDEDRIEHVKRKAMEYVDAAMVVNHKTHAH